MTDSPIWIVENGRLELYRRQGECCQCGKCCCENTISIQLATEPIDSSSNPDGSDDNEPWDEWEGWSIFEKGDSWQWWKSVIHDEKRGAPCGMLDGKLCEEWEADDRLNVCQIWPRHPREIAAFSECSYEIVKV